MLLRRGCACGGRRTVVAGPAEGPGCDRDALDRIRNLLVAVQGIWRCSARTKRGGGVQRALFHRSTNVRLPGDPSCDVEGRCVSFSVWHPGRLSVQRGTTTAHVIKATARPDCSFWPYLEYMLDCLHSIGYRNQDEASPRSRRPHELLTSPLVVFVTRSTPHAWRHNARHS